MANTPIKQETDLKTLEINVLSKEQYENERDNGSLIPNAFYLTPDDKEIFKAGEGVDSIVQVVSWDGGTEEEPLDNKPKATGYNSMALGPYCEALANFAVAINYNNKATGEASFAANTGADASGKFSFAANRDNHAIGANSFAIGRSDYAEGDNAFASGLQTSAKGKNSTTFGEMTVTGEQAGTDPNSGMNAIAMGYNTHANGKNSHSIGYGTWATGENSFAGGSGARANGKADFAFGFDTVASGGASFALGSNTYARASYSLAGGDHTDVGKQSYYAFAWGKELRTTKEYQAAFGKFNETTDDALFMIGNGTSDTKRKNALLIKADGSGLFAGKVTAGADPINAMDLTTKNYVDAKISNINGSVLPEDLYGDTLPTPGTPGKIFFLKAPKA